MKIIIAADPFALTDGLPQFADFLKEAAKKVEAIAPAGLPR